MTKITQIIPETVQKLEDEFGTSFFVKDKFGVSPEIELFFADGSVILRQENKGSVDLLGLSIGQTNDLLMALSLALEIPVRLQ
jgi:hypothetical protein